MIYLFWFLATLLASCGADGPRIQSPPEFFIGDHTAPHVSEPGAPRKKPELKPEAPPKPPNQNLDDAQWHTDYTRGLLDKRLNKDFLDLPRR
jgi:hypothetical protein